VLNISNTILPDFDTWTSMGILLEIVKIYLYIYAKQVAYILLTASASQLCPRVHDVPADKWNGIME